MINCTRNVSGHALTRRYEELTDGDLYQMLTGRGVRCEINCLGGKKVIFRIVKKCFNVNFHNANFIIKVPCTAQPYQSTVSKI